MLSSDEYKIALEVFEGPLDLLLYLIKRDEIDIYDIPIEHVTQQYMNYLDMMQTLDLDIAGEFLVMSATLMLIKSRMLLPEDERPEEEAEEEDPRWDLVRQLIEYKKFKDAALHLGMLEEEEQDSIPPEGISVELGKDSGVALKDVGIFDLLTAFNEALSKVKEEFVEEIFDERFTVAEKIQDVIRLLQHSDGKELSVTKLFGNMQSRQEIVCTFLAVLELLRLREVRAIRQEASFSEILLVPMTEAERSAADSDEVEEDVDEKE